MSAIATCRMVSDYNGWMNQRLYQAITLLMQAGIDPGATDIVAMPGIQAPAG